jgi:dTMP kinase
MGNLLHASFIVFEGVEGSGKSTQLHLLAEALRERGHLVVATCEPGGTAAGKEIRRILLDRPFSLTSLTELLLFCADRAQHVHEVIRPALQAGKIVLCDRYELSSVVYQGYAGCVAMEMVEKLNEIATGGLHPDLTVLLDIDPIIGLQRNGRVCAADRIERKTIEFHQRVREGYLLWAEKNPGLCLVADATQPPEVIHRQVLGRLGLSDQIESWEKPQ